MSPYGHGGIMVTCAVNYCIGRRTYIVAECADWLIAIWGQLPASAQAIIKRDVERAFAKDEIERNVIAKSSPKAAECEHIVYSLGDRMDREQWERVRRLWQ